MKNGNKETRQRQSQRERKREGVKNEKREKGGEIE